MKNKEIERKFILKTFPREIDKDNYILIKEGYLYVDELTEARIRSKEENNIKSFEFTTKVKIDEKGLIRLEKNYEIDEETFNKLQNDLIENTSMIIKKRYKYQISNLLAEIDIYLGNLEGLNIVEVEFKSLEEANNFIPPVFFGEEVTGVKEYKNSSLTFTRIKK